MSASLRFASLLGALALGACSSLNPFSSSSSGPKPAPLPAISAEQPVGRQWSASVGGAERFAFSPALAGEMLCTAARNGTVSCFDARSGARRWSRSVGVNLSGGVGMDERLVAVGTDDGVVIALDAGSGAERWKVRVSSEVLAPPEIGDGLVVVRSADSRIFAFEAEDGKRRWVYQRAAGILTVRAPAGIAIAGEVALAGLSGGRLVAIALKNGSVRWETTVSLPKGATILERLSDVVGAPAVQGREVCAVAYQGRAACFDLRTGQPLWSRELSSATGVSLDARHAYVSDEFGAVHALDRGTGRSVWKQDRLSHRQLSRPLPVGDAVVVADYQGYVHWLARETGAFVARAATDGSSVRVAPVIVPEGFVIQTVNGTLQAFSR